MKIITIVRGDESMSEAILSSCCLTPSIQKKNKESRFVSYIYCIFYAAHKVAGDNGFHTGVGVDDPVGPK